MPSAASLTDPVAVQAVLRRLARSPDTPWLHAEVARRMAERLAVVRLQPHTLVHWWPQLGGGAAELAAAYPQAQRVLVEPTPALCRLSARTLEPPWWAWRRRAPPVLEPAEVPAGAAELVWANMSLHAAPDPTVVIAQWHAALAVGGFLMFSSFGPDTLAGLRDLYLEAGWPRPTQAFVDMHDVGDQLVHAGFADPVMDMELLTLTWDDPQRALAELRSLGGNVDAGRFRGLRTPRWRSRLLERLERRRGPDGRLAFGFEIVYGHAFKAAPRVRVAEETRVSADTLRAMARRKGAA